jgi:hypothetical protein
MARKIAKAKKISEAMKASIQSLHSGWAGKSVFYSADLISDDVDLYDFVMATNK